MANKLIGNKWDELLADEWQKPYYLELREFLKEEYKNETIYPPAKDIYNALRFTDYDDVKAVILGQDPYHEPGQAQGLAFSVPEDMTMPPSLVNILKELSEDLGIARGAHGGAAARPESGDAAPGAEDGKTEAASFSTGTGAGHSAVLEPWARQGVLLLNTVLTVRAHRAGSHRGHGWEQFTDRVIELLAARTTPMVFVLWGANAQAKGDIILRSEAPGRRHLIIEAPHPSPLSAYRGFFGGRYFSRCNYFLEDSGLSPIDWSL